MKEPDDVPWRDLDRAARKEQRRLAKEENPNSSFISRVADWVDTPERELKQFMRFFLLGVIGMVLFLLAGAAVVLVFTINWVVSLFFLVCAVCYGIRWVVKD